VLAVSTVSSSTLGTLSVAVADLAPKLTVGAHVAVAVVDEGRGIAPDKLSRLFRKYAPEGRAHKSRSAEREGDGASAPRG